MAGLEPLLPHVYHEKQQPGSMLCAQHALNNLLQGNYFTAPDLSDIARGLDELEESYDDSNTGNNSTNMDDTGFFSVQVLDNALKVWGLNLTRWRSEVMRPYQQHPEKQLAFILNLEQHWFTLRRFGNASPDIDLDDGNGHWLNLNSFLESAERVGKLYLGMVLQQAETEGYSVFAVTQADPDSPLALPRTQGDMIASTLPEPNLSTATNLQRTFSSNFKTPSSSDQGKPTSEDDNFEDEDYELQAALQASLMGDTESTSPLAAASASSNTWPQISQIEPSSRSSLPTMAVNPPSAAGFSLPGHADVDPVTASMERNRVLLQRMREQQEFAQREMWSETDLTTEEQTALEQRRAARQRQEEEEDAELMRAIEESEALARQQRHEPPESTSVIESLPSTTSALTNRAYDDDDAEFQAALKASLEHHQGQSQSAPSSATPSSETDDAESIMSDSTTTLEEPAEAALTVDEIRQRRLARFGI